jgi:hypothetical protein
MTTLVFPESAKIFTQASSAFTKPEIGFQLLIIIHPNQIPKNKERKTCLVRMAKSMAIKGGKMDTQP